MAPGSTVDVDRDEGGDGTDVKISIRAPKRKKREAVGVGAQGGEEELEGDSPEVPEADGADTELVRGEAHQEDSAIIWSTPRMLSAQEVADRTVALLDGKKLVEAIPRYRGWQARAAAMTPRLGLKMTRAMRRTGERKREKERRANG